MQWMESKGSGDRMKSKVIFKEKFTNTNMVNGVQIGLAVKLIKA